MNLLNICQNILKETKSSNIPISIIGNSEDSATQIFEAIKISTTELTRNYQWQELVKENNFYGVLNQDSYDLPDDFDRFVDDTFWNITQGFKIIGPLTASDWANLKNYMINQSNVIEYFNIRNNKIYLHLTPISNDNYSYNYISNKIIKDTTGVLKKDWTSDTDSIAIDPYILRLDATWRFLEMQGRAYAEKQRTANLAISERVKSNGSRTAIIHQGKVNQGVAVSTIKPIIYFNPLTTQYIF
jgi:hypothetical protein